ncbi:MBL fold metallo-hydrolase [Candidatus Aerophobetes bacterium]|uniref:MBL fold metallo-hydrolase n=1 Tax=Aerophobetes bacterium TaxID=2030807 RepID=A0A2A4YFV8_UNCAE|nr:MAG: MBL fold metallo-hydrolase [Candidatus Aerophobetes bacterium]
MPASACQYTFFGTSASMGIPSIGCNCAVCTSCEKKNKRTRPAGLLEVANKKFLLDVGPDIRAQCLEHKLEDIDGLILTHTHYDHVAGIDELRAISFRKKAPIPLLASQSSINDIKSKMSYLFEPKSHRADIFSCQVIENNMQSVEFCGVNFSCIFYSQLGMPVVGYKVGDFAFVTDIKNHDKGIYESLKGVRTLVLSAIDFTPTRAHISIDEAMDIAKKSNAERLILTHIGHELEHMSTTEKLPENVELAYDGMVVTFDPKA